MPALLRLCSAWRFLNWKLILRNGIWSTLLVIVKRCNEFMKIKRMTIVILLCFAIVSCTTQQMAFTATPYPTLAAPELTTEHISGWVVYSALVSREPAANQIFLKNLDTGEVTQLTNTRNNSSPKWSPDGSKIVFVSFTKENLHDIYIMNQDGSGQTPIVATSADEYFPDWSPDGKQILFSSFSRSSASEIYLFDLASKDVKKLTNTIKDDYLPTWSADGKYIAFTFGMGDSYTQIYTMNNDGTVVRQITNSDLGEFNSTPVWCPDDTCIIFEGGRGGSQLLLLDLDSQTASPLLGNVFEPSLIQSWPRRSPVRGYITFIVGETSYAMDMKTKKIYSLGVTGISLYP